MFQLMVWEKYIQNIQVKNQLELIMCFVITDVGILAVKLPMGENVVKIIVLLMFWKLGNNVGKN